MVLALIMVISVGGMRRVLAVFGGPLLLRICGEVIFIGDLFVGLTAVVGGITLALGIDKFPAEWLVGTPFRSYLIPGLILMVVVGGSASVAAVSVLQTSGRSALLSILAGIILLGWLVGERLILPKAAFPPQFSWLEGIYIGAGLLMVLPSLAVRWYSRERAG